MVDIPDKADVRPLRDLLVSTFSTFPEKTSTVCSKTALAALVMVPATETTASITHLRVMISHSSEISGTMQVTDVTTPFTLTSSLSTAASRYAESSQKALLSLRISSLTFEITARVT